MKTRLFKHWLVLLTISISCTTAAQELLTISHSCFYEGEDKAGDYYTFDASDEADVIVLEICNAVSLEKNFIVRSSNVGNALATEVGGKRVILYSTSFLEKFKADARTRWAAYSVLAHEIGHHLNGHDFNESDSKKRKTMELEADRFSGGALRLLGASLEEAKAGLETLNSDWETQTHPPVSARREAIASGWKKQDERLKTLGIDNSIKQPEEPENTDSDNDGIPNAQDKCPDRKGSVQNYGCPELPATMVRIPGGVFEMGDVFGDGHELSKPVHPVMLDDFFIGRTEVTFDEYDTYCKATGATQPFDEGWGRGKNPVINVSWIEAVQYCNWLSSQYGLSSVYSIENDDVTADWTANGFRLPTEAEWEFAARALRNSEGQVQGGGKVRFGNSTNHANPAQINFNGEKQFATSFSSAGPNRQKIVPVGSFSPNEFGLYEMSGNVDEWVWDFYGPYSNARELNPHGPVSGTTHMQRGGSWNAGPIAIQTTARSNWGGARSKENDVGFRLARNAD